MANIITLGNPESQFVNAFAAQTQANAAADAQLSQNADANRRANQASDREDDANDRANAQEARDSTQFRATVNVSSSTFSGWDKNADRSTWSPGLIDKAEAIDRMYDDHDRSYGDQKAALALGGAGAMASFAADLSAFHGERDMNALIQAAAQFGDLPEELQAAIDEYESGNGSGGGGHSAADVAGMLRRHINSQLGSQVDMQWRDEQSRISADFRIWLSANEDPNAGEGESENFKDARDAWKAVDAALVSGSGNTRRDIEGLIGKARGQSIILQDEESRQAYGDMTSKRLVTEKTLDESLQWVAFARDFDSSMGESPFTVFTSMMKGASQNGHAQRFGHSWDNPQLIKQREILGNLMAAAQQEFGEDIPYSELMERAHNRIVRGNNMIEEHLTPDVEGEKVSQNSQYEAALEFLTTFPNATMARYPGNPILGTLMSSGDDLIEGWGSVAKLQNVPDFAMNNTKSSGKMYPLMGKTITGLLSEHDSVGHVDDGGGLGVPRGAYGIARIIDNHGIDYADITEMSLPEVMTKYPDAGRDIFFWLNSEAVRTGVQLPGQRGSSTFRTQIGRVLDATGIPGLEGGMLQGSGDKDSGSRMTFREALRADDKAAGAYLPSKASAKVIERRVAVREADAQGMSLAPVADSPEPMPWETGGAPGAPEEEMPLAPEEEMAGAGEMPPDAQAGPPLPPDDDAQGAPAEGVEIPVDGPWSKISNAAAIQVGTKLGYLTDELREVVANDPMLRTPDQKKKIDDMLSNIEVLEEKAKPKKDAMNDGSRQRALAYGALKRLASAKGKLEKYLQSTGPDGTADSRAKAEKARALGDYVKSEMARIQSILDKQGAEDAEDASWAAADAAKDIYKKIKAFRTEKELKELIGKDNITRAKLVGVIALALEDPRGAVARGVLAIATGKPYSAKDRAALLRALNDKSSKDRGAARADKRAHDKKLRDKEMEEKLRDKEMDRKAKAKSEWMKRKARQHGGRRH